MWQDSIFYIEDKLEIVDTDTQNILGDMSVTCQQSCYNILYVNKL